MGRKAKGPGFKMKGHTLPGINQRSETPNMPDGRSASSPFQAKTPGDSPLQKGFWGKALNVLTGGAAGAIGQGLKGNWKGAGKSLLSGGMASFGKKGLGGADPAAAAQTGTPEEQEAAMLAAQQQAQNVGATPMAMKMDKTKQRKTVGGKLGGNLYKTSPLQQKEGEAETVAGQYLEPAGKNKYKDVDTGETYVDTAGVVGVDRDGFVVDNDYMIEGNEIIGVKKEKSGPSKVPQSEGEQGPPPVTTEDLR